MLEIRNVVKEYKVGKRANDNITISVKAGEVYGLLGPNGAGKTTLVSQIVGLTRPTSGSITINGRDVVAHPAYARQASSLQPQAQIKLIGITGRQAIEVVGRIRGGEKKQVRRRTDELLEALDIAEWENKGGEKMSGGVARLISFCMTVVVPGKIVMLDEPTNDVDPVRRRLLWKEVRHLADMGSAVLLVTHNVLEAEKAVDRLAIISNGRVLLEGTPGALKAEVSNAYHLELLLANGQIPELPAYTLTSHTQGNRLTITIPSEQVERAMAWANELRLRNVAEEFNLGAATLENIYTQMMDREKIPVELVEA